MSGGPSTITKTNEGHTYRQAEDIDESLLSRIVDATEKRIEARGSRPSPFDLRTFEEIESFAERMARSSLCPKAWLGKPDDIIMAVIKGKELGLPPIAALESIYVVDGHPSLFGEAIPGLCMQTGQVQDFTEHFEGDGDTLTAVCVVIRKGRSPMEGRFSIADTRIAGLGNVHRKFPRDMIMWRARHRAWHGAFPDVLKGLGTKEIEEEEASRPKWPVPQPEESWFQRKSAAERGDWNDDWFADLAQRLLGEPNAYRWMDMLLAALPDAPTMRDIDELTDFPHIQQVLMNAPDQAKATIADAFTEARKRFAQKEPDKKPETASQPAKEKPPQEKKPEPTQTAEPAESVAQASETSAEAFEAYLLDEFGDPVGDEPITSPMRFASDLWILINTKSRDQRANIIEQNADGIADARAADPRAAESLALLDEEEPTYAPEIAVIPLSIERGKGNFAQYLRDFKSAIATVSAAQYIDWIAAQHPQFTGAPASSRMLIVKAAVERAKALGIEPPAIITQTPEKQPNTTARASSEPDRDTTTVEGLVAELNECTTANACTLWSNRMTTVAMRTRLDREGKTELVKRLDMAFNDRMAVLRAGA